VYNIVLETQLAAIALCRPGATWSEVNAAANAQMLKGLLSAGQNFSSDKFRKFFLLIADQNNSF